MDLLPATYIHYALNLDYYLLNVTHNFLPLNWPNTWLYSTYTVFLACAPANNRLTQVTKMYSEALVYVIVSVSFN